DEIEGDLGWHGSLPLSRSRISGYVGDTRTHRTGSPSSLPPPEGGAMILTDDDDLAWVFIELGLAALGLALLAGLAGGVGLSAIPLYLLGGLAFGNGGLLPLRFSEGFVQVGAEIGVLLLLFMLGLEHSGAELGATLRAGWASGVEDFLFNFTPGLL